MLLLPTLRYIFFSYLQFAYSAVSAGGPKEQFAGIPPCLHSGSSSDVVGEVEGVVVVLILVVVLEKQIGFSMQLESLGFWHCCKVSLKCRLGGQHISHNPLFAHW